MERMCVNVCVHTRTHHTRTCTHAHMHTCTHAHMHTCTRAHVHTCTRAHMHTCTRTHTRTHTHTHTHTNGEQVRQIYNYYKKHGHETIVMGARCLSSKPQPPNRKAYTLNYSKHGHETGVMGAG